MDICRKLVETHIHFVDVFSEMLIFVQMCVYGTERITDKKIDRNVYHNDCQDFIALQFLF